MLVARLFGRALLLGCLGSLQAGAASPDFERVIAPILKERCLECHSATDKAGGLDLSTRAGLLKGGENGDAIELDQPLESLLIRKVATGEMPPKKAGKARPLPPQEVDRLKEWVKQGASWPDNRVLDPFETTTESRGGRDFWSLQAVQRPEVPRLKQPDRASNPLDAFILAKLESKGWEPAPEASRRVLIRRLHQDLTGLPPSYDEVETFANDPNPAAYEHLVEQLLASPRFGERWARHWLDIARFAETSGYERDQVKPYAWKYRDWVVQAFNRDKPFDAFIKEQIAGDELPNRSPETLTGTGFLRLGTWNDEPNDPNEYKYERLEDLVHTTSTAFLGMTVKCARCHDHKFDPIRQTDYYRMAASFWAGYIEPGPREWVGGPPPAAAPEILAWTDRGRVAPEFHLLKKGDHNRPAQVIKPGQLSMIPALDRPYAEPATGATSSQRRLQLAQWIADPRNPLTARVWVNRVWGYHFGHSIVRSPDNFGFTGDKPTHPELLDWLASELVSNGWRTKPLHRLILLSNTYRQASIHPRQDEYARSDAGNRLWWHAERTRIDAEAIRDALLISSGRLNLSKIGGPSFYPEISSEALEGLSMKGNEWKASPPDDRQRRGLYSFTKRGLLPPLMTTFDLPDTTLPCGKRDVTLVAPQALALMNNGFVHEQSQAIARDLIRQAPDSPGRVKAAWQRILCRNPTEGELKLASEHLGQISKHGSGSQAEFLSLASLCHVLLNSNEFVYVD